MRRSRTVETLPKTLPVAVVAMLCLCAVSGVEVDRPIRGRTASIEALTLVGRFAQVARQSRSSVAANHPKPTPTVIVDLLPDRVVICDDASLSHATPLRDALLNLPPPPEAHVL